MIEGPAGGRSLRAPLTDRLQLLGLEQRPRRGDPSNTLSSLYGNAQGDIVMETNTDATSDYWAVRYTGADHGGSTARPQLAQPS